MANKILDVTKHSKTKADAVVEVTATSASSLLTSLTAYQSNEVYTDLALDSIYVCDSKSVPDQYDNLKEEQYIKNLMLDELSRESIKIMTDPSQSVPKNAEDRNGFKVTKSINVKAVLNAIDNIFSFIPGERILYPEFGSRLREYLYEGITQYNVEQIIAEIRRQFLKYDPRVVVDNITDISQLSDTDTNTVVLRVTYHIKGLPRRLYDYDMSYTRATE